MPLQGGHIDFKEHPTYSANNDILKELSQKNFFSLRLGELVFRGWKLKKGALNKNSQSITLTQEGIRAQIEQKGVDMRIGLDIASLSLKNHIDCIVLVTGDSDFIPAIKFARREGKQVFLFTLGHNVINDLITHSDQHIIDTPESLSGRQPV